MEEEKRGEDSERNMAAEEASVKKESGGVMTIQIQIQEAVSGFQRLSFVTERSLPLRRVFLDFCDRLDLVYTTVRFFNPEGKAIKEDQTPEECDIEDGDVINAFYGQIGG